MSYVAPPFIQFRPIEGWTNLKYDITHFVMAGVYLAILIVAIVMFIKFVYSSRIFKGTFIAGTISRLIFFISQPFIIEDIVILNEAANFILTSLPSFFYFSTYLMLLIYWGELYRTNDSFKALKHRKIFLLFILVNVVMYLIVGGLFLLDFLLGHPGLSSVVHPLNVFERSVLFMAAGMYFAVVMSFFCYGYYNYRSTHANTGMIIQHTQRRKKLLRRIGSLTLVPMICFVFRGAIIIWSIYTPSSGGFWWLDAVYYLTLEVAPVAMMLGTYIPQRRATPAPAPPRTASQESQSPLLLTQSLDRGPLI